ERQGDLNAQVAACHTGAVRLQEIVERYGISRVRRVMIALQEYSEQMMRAFLAKVPAGRYEAEDFLDDDGAGSGPVRIALTVGLWLGSGENRGDSQAGERAATQTVGHGGFQRQLPSGGRQHQCR